MTFDEAFPRLINVEQGYVNDPRDPGGETKYGVTRRTYPGEDIKNLTLDRAKAFYRRDFWGPAGCDVVPDALKYDLFDVAVNSGPKQAIKLLQQALGVREDGVLGPQTLLALSSISPQLAAARLAGARLKFMAGLETWALFGRGWARRVADNLLSLGAKP